MMGSSSAGATKISGLPESPYKRIVLGGGCFWCIEAVYARVDGVVTARSGYQGGHLQDPTYKAVCGGDTGHAEVVEVVYEPDKVSLQELLDIFFQAHDPTTKDRQGNDVGTQYRSAIYYDDPQDREVIDTCMAAVSSSKGWTLTTEVRQITPEMPFYVAEDHHLAYFQNNPNQGYCRAVIAPKLKKISNAKYSEKGRL